jgi:L-threonylcarbamoyladenylate synthase
LFETKIINDPLLASELIKRGGTVAFPTETVYGLGANVFDEAAICKIFAAKGRPADNPLIAHIANLGMLDQLTGEVNGVAQALIDRFFPGPLTLVLRKAPAVPLIATAGLATIGIRMPRHPLAQEFLSACGVPVVAPSANLSGRPSPTTWQAVKEDLDGRIDAILCGDQTEVGLESTVVDCTGAAPIVLRSGAVTLEQLRSVVPSTRLASQGIDELVRSPGTHHRHYSPRAKVELVDNPSSARGGADTAFIGVGTPPGAVEFGFQYIAATVEDYAHELFRFYRVCDDQGIRTIYCQRVAETGLGLALMDRLRRAAEEELAADLRG